MGLRCWCCCCLASRKAASLERFDDRASHERPFSSQRRQVGTSKQISHRQLIRVSMETYCTITLGFCLCASLTSEGSWLKITCVNVYGGFILLLVHRVVVTLQKIPSYIVRSSGFNGRGRKSTHVVWNEKWQMEHSNRSGLVSVFDD